FSVRDATTFDAAPNTITVDVTAVNDAPTGANATVTATEDTPLVLTAANFGFSDVDVGDTLGAVRIDTVATAGTLQYDTTGTGTWAAVTAGQVITSADIGANRLRFSPAANANGAGYATFTFSVRDATAFDAAPNTITVDVTAVNDAPTGANATVTATEDTPLILTAANFGFSDVDPGDTLGAVRVDSIATAGTLQYDTTGTGTWAAVTAGQVITSADIGANRLRFSPAANANGAGYATFTFSVRDATAFDAAP